ncbi:MAG: n-acetylglutamate synthase [Blastocatellia bacterium]|nr:n-acetylglutamate synthase [Blastocatellia bacterium]
MHGINYNDRRFASVANTENGEVSAETIFHYRQEGEIVWATYAGGEIRFGTLLARVDEEDCLEMRYQHLNAAGEWRSGICRSTPERLPDGRLRMHERWRWTSGDESSGESIIEEISPGKASE